MTKAQEYGKSLVFSATKKSSLHKLQRAQLKEAVQNEIKNRKIEFKQSISPMINPSRIENNEETLERPAVNKRMIRDRDSRPVASAGRDQCYTEH